MYSDVAKNIILFVCCCFSFNFLNGRDIQETVLRGHEFFQKGDIDKALSCYDSIEKKGPATWYNAAICHFKKGEHLKSLACLAKAERSSKCWQLPQVYRLMDKVGEEVCFDGRFIVVKFFYRALVYFSSLLTLFGWQLMFLLLWFLLLFLSARLAKRRSYMLIALLAGAVIVSASTLYMKYALTNMEYALITDDKVKLCSGPGDDFCDLKTISCAQYAKVVDENENWIKVEHAGSIGWVKASSITRI